MTRSEIIKAFERHAEITGRKTTTIGQYATTDRHIYQRLKSGGAVHEKTLQTLSAWFEKQ